MWQPCIQVTLKTYKKCLKSNYLSIGRWNVEYLTDNWASILKNEQKLNDRTLINKKIRHNFQGKFDLISFFFNRKRLSTKKSNLFRVLQNIFKLA